MQPKTEEFLYFLLWSAEALTRPTFRNLNESFESWAYRNGLLRQLAKLEKEQWVERKTASSRDRIFRLTEEGRLHALGGRDPRAQWSRRWDGRWRLVLYDLPAGQDKERARLRRYLRERAFGYLQNSVWITPDPLEEELLILRGGEIDVETLILLEARPCAGESDGEIVAGAWDFEGVNRRYGKYLKILARRPGGPVTTPAQARALRSWARGEREAWLAAVRWDPLLPERLLPSEYLGRQAWRKRIKALSGAHRGLQKFRPQN